MTSSSTARPFPFPGDTEGSPRLGPGDAGVMTQLGMPSASRWRQSPSKERTLRQGPLQTMYAVVIVLQALAEMPWVEFHSNRARPIIDSRRRSKSCTGCEDGWNSRRARGMPMFAGCMFTREMVRLCPLVEVVENKHTYSRLLCIPSQGLGAPTFAIKVLPVSVNGKRHTAGVAVVRVCVQ